MTMPICANIKQTARKLSLIGFRQGIYRHTGTYGNMNPLHYWRRHEWVRASLFANPHHRTPTRLHPTPASFASFTKSSANVGVSTGRRVKPWCR